MNDSQESTEQDSTQTVSEQTPDPGSSQPETTPLGPIDENVYLSTPEALAINTDQGQDRRIASADDSGVVPVDDAPHPSVDLQAQYPWQLAVTGIYRNLNIAQIRSL